ncbi:hypothetical protein C8J57DRAFT_178077 [Mycena rebaudengoi]|nr:hypothetical protein C8J57DRAFT_178077 [Mycena rebaudengoi]
MVWLSISSFGGLLSCSNTARGSATQPLALHAQTTMRNLDNTYQGLGNLINAEELEAEQMILDLENPHSLTMMGNLAITYGGLGRLTDEELKVVELEMQRQTLGPKHPDTQRLDVKDLEAVLQYEQATVEKTPQGHPNLAGHLHNLANSFTDRYRSSGDIKDLEAALQHNQATGEQTPQGHPDLAGCLRNLALSFTNRYQRSGDMEDLEAALRHNQAAVEQTPQGHPDLAGHLQSLAISFRHRYQRSGDVKDLEAALQNNQAAVEQTPEGHPNLAGRLQSLAVSFMDRYQRSGDVKDLEAALQHNQASVEQTPQGHPDLAGRLQSLAVSFMDRYQRSGDVKDLEAALQHNQASVEQTPRGHPDLAGRLQNLAISFKDRYQRSGDVKDLEAALQHNQAAVEQTPEGHPDRAGHLQSLAISFRHRYRRSGDVKDLEAALQSDQAAVEQTPEGHPALPGRLQSLAISFRDRYQRSGDVKDLEAALQNDQAAVEQTPEGHPALAGRLQNLAALFRDRYRRSGNVKDLEAALQNDQAAVEQTPEGHPDLAGRLQSLAVSLMDRYQRFGDVKDLEAALQNNQAAVGQTPEGHPDLAERLRNLALSFTNRYQRSGDIKDLEAALQNNQAAVEQTPQGHPDLAGQLQSLAVSFMDRYRRSGDVKDLEAALQNDQAAVEQTPEGHPDLAGRLQSLAVSFMDRYQRSGNVKDLEAALQHNQAAVEQTPWGHPDLAGRLQNLAISFTDRYQRFGDVKDLEAALQHNQAAVEQTPQGHPDLAGHLQNLAISFTDRYQRSGDIKDLEAALQHNQAAVEQTPQGHPNLAGRLQNLSISFTDRYQRSGDMKDLEAALQHNQAAVEQWRQTLGPDHPDTLIAMANLANTYRDLGKLTEAEKLEVIVLEMRRQILGSDHPDTLTAMANLAVIYWGLGRLIDAEQLQVVVLEKREQTLGPDHPYTLSAMVNLANIYRGLGKLADAEALEVVVLDTLGPALKAMGYPSATYWGHQKSKNAYTATVAIDPLFTAPPPEMPEMDAPQKGSTFVIYTPKDMDSPLDLPTGTTTALRPEDVEILENEFPDGGTISSVHSPDKAILWVEAHYEDQLLKSMRSHGIGGPIASMLSSDIPALAIFGSFLEKSVVQAAQLLADSSRIMVMLRPITDDPIPKWERGRVTIYGDNHDDKKPKGTWREDSDDNQSDAGQQTIDSDDSSAASMDETNEMYAINGVLRLRGGAGDDDYSPWLGPDHNFSYTVTLRPNTGGEQCIRLRSKIQFKVQTEYTDHTRTVRRPQIVSWTRFWASSDVLEVFANRSYSSAGFLAHGELIHEISDIPCADFTPPNHTTKATKTKTDQDTTALTLHAGMKTYGTAAYTKNKIEANAVEKANDRVTPKCAVYSREGKVWDEADINGEPLSFHSMIFSYQPEVDNNGEQYPMKVEFSMGITTMSGENPERISFIAVNQTHLWIPDEQLLAKGYGVVFNSSCYISDIQTDERNPVHERATMERTVSSLTSIPEKTLNKLRSEAAVSLAVGLLKQKDPERKSGIFRKMTKKLSGIAHRKPSPNNQIPAIRLYECISRGWDVTHAKWRLPIYPTLDRNFRPPDKTSPAAWKLEVVDAKGTVLMDHDDNGTSTVPQTPAPINTLQLPQAGVAGGSGSSGIATASQSSSIPSQLSAGVPSMVSTPATSIGVPAAGPPTSLSGQVAADDDTTTPEVGPSKSKGKGRAL